MVDAPGAGAGSDGGGDTRGAGAGPDGGGDTRGAEADSDDGSDARGAEADSDGGGLGRRASGNGLVRLEAGGTSGAAVVGPGTPGTIVGFVATDDPVATVRPGVTGGPVVTGGPGVTGPVTAFLTSREDCWPAGVVDGAAAFTTVPVLDSASGGVGRGGSMGGVP